MKTTIILILFGIILGLAYLTRPSQRSFQAIVAQQLQDRAATASASSDLPRPIDADALLQDITYKDRFLWVDVQKNGKTVYTGAFGHWFQWGQIHESPTDPTPIKLPV